MFLDWKDVRDPRGCRREISDIGILMKEGFGFRLRRTNKSSSQSIERASERNRKGFSCCGDEDEDGTPDRYLY